MKMEIKVHIQYPWKIGDSPYYKYLIEYPPKEIFYIKSKIKAGVLTNTKRFFLIKNLKIFIRTFMKLFLKNVPNAHLSPKGKHDLIHCAHCLSRNKDKPWVADIEFVNQFWISLNKTNKKRKIEEILMRDNCKKILPWTYESAREIINLFPNLEKKIEVVYPAVPLGKRNTKKDEKITILYSTRYFWLKGGLIALEVYRKLKKHYGNKIDLIFISDVPKKIKMRYPDLKIKNLVPQKEMFELYSKSDIFFYPSFMDTFGFGQLEAMSFGLPIVTLNTKFTKSRKEIIENNKNGLIFDVSDKLTDKIIGQKERLFLGDQEKRMIKKLFKNCCKLIDDKKIRNNLSKNSIRLIKEGKFSIKERNKKLIKLYEGASKLKK